MKGPRVRILVVEDDPLIREFTVEALREEGYDVIHASTGEEALAWCMRQAADVFVTDINATRKGRRMVDRRTLSRASSRTAGDLRKWILAGIGSSSLGHLPAEALSSGRDLASRKAIDEKSTCIGSGVAVSGCLYRCGSEASVAEARADRQYAPAFHVLHERDFGQSLHHAVVVHDDSRVVFPDLGNSFD